MAIYNIAALGGIAYFLSVFLGASNVAAAVILRCIGIFASATFAVVLIMTPKLLVIEGVIKSPFGNSTQSQNSEIESSGRVSNRQSESQAREEQESAAVLPAPLLTAASSTLTGSQLARLGGGHEDDNAYENMANKSRNDVALESNDARVVSSAQSDNLHDRGGIERAGGVGKWAGDEENGGITATVDGAAFVKPDASSNRVRSSKKYAPDAVVPFTPNEDS